MDSTLVAELEVVFGGRGSDLLMCWMAVSPVIFVAFCSADIGLPASLVPPAGTLQLMSCADCTQDLTDSAKEGVGAQREDIEPLLAKSISHCGIFFIYL